MASFWVSGVSATTIVGTNDRQGATMNTPERLSESTPTTPVKRIPRWAYIAGGVLVLAGIGALMPDEKSEHSQSQSQKCGSLYGVEVADTEVAETLQMMIAAYDGHGIEGQVLSVPYVSAGYGDRATGYGWRHLVMAKVTPENDWGIWALSAKINNQLGTFSVVNDVAGKVTTEIRAPQSQMDMIQMQDALASPAGRALWSCRR